MENSKIEWTHNTFNPWWGCEKVSEGCRNCYAERESHRRAFDIWGKDKDKRFLSDNYWKQPLIWNKKAGLNGERYRVFCASMADVYEDNDNVILSRERLWEIIANTHYLDWLLLTKRPENIMPFSPWGNNWPTNIWVMSSVENQQCADKRIPELLKVPAVVRGLSIEPMIGPIDLTTWISQLQFVIVGGESGPRQKIRRMNIEWARTIRDQCIAANVPFFFKQWGQFDQNGKYQHNKHFEGYNLLDGEIWQQFPNNYKLNSKEVG